MQNQIYYLRSTVRVVDLQIPAFEQLGQFSLSISDITLVSPPARKLSPLTIDLASSLGVSLPWLRAAHRDDWL
jgi:hypothetical protein